MRRWREESAQVHSEELSANCGQKGFISSGRSRSRCERSKVLYCRSEDFIFTFSEVTGGHGVNGDVVNNLNR